MKAKEAELEKLRSEIQKLREELTKAKAEIAVLSDKPPIINLSEARGYNFDVGKSALSADFNQKLKEIIIPELKREGQRYNATVIEVIGHTDEQRVPPNTTSNLDTQLLGYPSSLFMGFTLMSMPSSFPKALFQNAVR